MRGARSTIGLAVAALLLAPAAAAASDRLLVGFDPGVADAGARADALAQAGERRLETVVSASTLTAWDCGGAYRGMGEGDPGVCRQWYMGPSGEPSAGIADAWARIERAPPVTVALVDSGVDMRHPDLVSQLWTNPADGTHGFNVLTGTHDPSDVLGHGTSVAGVLAASAGNGIGVAGACPSCRIMPVVVVRSGVNDVDASAVLKGIEVAAANGAKVINLSLSGEAQDLTPFIAVFRAHPSITFVASAGNQGRSNDEHPRFPCNAAAAVANALCVAATDPGDALVRNSNWGSSVAIAAPGVDLYTTVPGGEGTAEGTSFAAPLVSAAAAVLRGEGASARQSVRAIIDGAETPRALAGRSPSRRLSIAGALAVFDTMPFDVDPPPPSVDGPPPVQAQPPGTGGHAGPPPAAWRPERDPYRLVVHTARWKGGKLLLPVRCKAACSLTVRVYAGSQRLISSWLSFARATSKTLTVRMSKRTYQRLGQLRIQIAGVRTTTLVRRPAAAPRRAPPRGITSERPV